MARLKIIRYGAPGLRGKAKKISKITPDILKILDDMVGVLADMPGIGLAASQVGISKRLMIIDATLGIPPRKFLKIINPVIVHTEGTQTSEEGCLSFPGIFAEITRPQLVRIEGTNENGFFFGMEGTGLLARVILHEFDHLEGRLFIDYLSALRREEIKREIRRLVKTGEWNSAVGDNAVAR